MKVQVDAELCTGHGRCWTLAPGVFHADDSGLNAAAGSVIDVAPKDEAAATVGVHSCPEGALIVIDTSSEDR